MRVDESNEYIKNQCSLVVRIDGNEIEVPVTFGMTAEEIRMIYPFLLSIVNDKIENPVMQFNRSKERGEFASLSEDEYNTELHRVVAQSKYWYEKPEAGLLDIAIRFALDIKMRGISDLESIFSLTPTYRPYKLKPVTEEEADIIMQRLKLDDSEPVQDMPSADDVIVDDDLSDIEEAEAQVQEDAEIFDEESDDMTDSHDSIEEDVSDELETDDNQSSENPEESLDEDVSDDLEPDVQSSNHDADDMDKDEQQIDDKVVDDVSSTDNEDGFIETMRKDMENIDASKYQMEYKPTLLSEDQIRDGLLVRDDENDKPVSVIDTASESEEELDEELDEEIDEELDDEFDDESSDDDDDFDIHEASFADDDE